MTRILRRCALLAAIVLAVSANAAAAYTAKTLYAFCSQGGCNDGVEPTGALVMDPAGTLYGSYSRFGVGGSFTLTPDGSGGWSYGSLCQKSGRCPAYGLGRLVLSNKGHLFGVSYHGSYNHNGAVFEASRDAKHPQGTSKRLHDFCYQYDCPNDDGFFPLSGLTYAGAAAGIPYDEKTPLYGTASQGGTTTFFGIAYMMFPPKHGAKDWQETVIHNFCTANNCGDGGSPAGPMIMDAQGNLFGTTQYGGPDNRGIVFEMSYTKRSKTWSTKRLYAFCALDGCADGSRPIGGVIMDAQGALYGTTQNGGNACALDNEGCGTLFKLTPSGGTWQFTSLHSFCPAAGCADGAFPVAGVVIDASGNLFGTTLYGGANQTDFQHKGGGTVYEFGASTFTTIHSFCQETNCADGTYPTGDLLLDPQGNLFGTTTRGGTPVSGGEGVVFELMP